MLSGVAEGHSFRSLDVPGAYMRAPNDPNVRVVMAQPTRSDGTQLHPGKVCLLRRAMPGEKSANQNWDSWRDHWITNWGWTKVLAEPSMFWINTPNGVARLEADNDDFFFSAPNDEDLDNITKPFIDAWQCTIQRLDHGQSIEKSARTEHGPPQSFQHVGLKIARLQNGGIKISNPKIIEKILAAKGLLGANPVSVPYVINADLTARKDSEPTVDTKAYMSDVGSLRFIADTTHPGISYIVGVLGRHLHNPSQGHVDALKPIDRYLATRTDDGPVYDKKGPLEFTCYTDSDYAGCKDTRKSVSGSLLTANAQLLM